MKQRRPGIKICKRRGNE